MEEWDSLLKKGNIGIYHCCEVTEIFLFNKKSKEICNLFTLLVLEEKPIDDVNEQLLGERIKVNEDCFIGIKRFWMTLDEAKAKLKNLKNKNCWTLSDSNHRISKLKYIPKQFITSNDGIRLNHILKNNFHNGSYIIEFFDESKPSLEDLLNVEKLKRFNRICEDIKKVVPIDLSVARDRIGNFVFQFPVTILEIDSTALSSWDGIDLKFTWHNQLEELPDCLIQAESEIDRNYLASVIDNYNKMDTQIIKVGNLDGMNHIRIWRKEPNLLLYSFTGSYLRDFNLQMNIVNPEPRLFEIKGNPQQVEVVSSDSHTSKEQSQSYTTQIANNLYDSEKRRLEETLSFKQYIEIDSDKALDDIRKLIKQNDENGVFLWDPYLTAVDILKTLYFSSTAGVKLRAISSFDRKVKKAYIDEFDEEDIKSTNDYIQKNKLVLDNTNHNNYRLNLEFRIQHTTFGWDFHDRFLIFPSSKTRKAKVYSLGTSLNSYGKSHHILQEVSHPQPVVDAFNDLWEKLNHKDCIVWKYPK